MAKAKKRKDGRFQKKFTIDGKQHFVYGKTREEVERKAYEKRQQILAGIEAHDHPTLDQYYESWSKAQEGKVKGSTLRGQDSHYARGANVTISGINKRLGDMRLDRITVDDMREVQSTLRGLGLSTAYVNNCMKQISRLMGDAIKERRIDYNPCCLVGKLRRTEEEARDTIHRALTVEETDAFFENAKDCFYYNVFRFAVNTGMRLGEIGALYTTDIRGGNITVERTLTRTRDHGYEIGDSAKTDAGRRRIPLNDALREIIADQREVNRAIYGGSVTPMRELIFRSPTGKLIRGGMLCSAIRRICEKSGVEYFTMHAFRDTFATRLIENGVDVRTVQELMGHKNYVITMNLYAHVMDQTKKDAMGKISIAI